MIVMVMFLMHPIPSLFLDCHGLVLSLGFWFNRGIFRHDRLDLMSFYCEFCDLHLHI